MNFQHFPKQVRIVEVGPRDGLQNEPRVLDTQTKEEFVRRLSKSGLKTVEVTSFVRPDRIPQMRDAGRLYGRVKDLDLAMPCLVPNTRGLEEALGAGVKEIALFTSTSNTFNQKNVGAPLKESLVRIGEVADRAAKEKIRMRGYVSTAFGCPYEGESSDRLLFETVEFFFSKGVYEVVLGDTIGCAVPKQVDRVLEEYKKSFPVSRLALHFHDTRGLALANIQTALNCGVRSFDSAAGGIGGCAYARGSGGNVATEDVVYFLHSLGIETGVCLESVAETSEWMMKTLNRATSSKVLQAYLNSGKKLVGPFV